MKILFYFIRIGEVMATFFFFFFFKMYCWKIKQENEGKNRNCVKTFSLLFTDDSGFLLFWVACVLNEAASQVHWPCGQK